MTTNDHTPAPSERCYSDVLILGGGAAGLSLALNLADHCQITVLSKSSLNQGSTYYAQGGVAAVLDEKDSLESHIEDTVEAGAGLCHRDIVEYSVSRSRECIEWLMDQGVKFTTAKEANGTAKDFSNYHLTKEGGHSHRRVIHAADATGRAIFEALSARAQAHPNITFRTTSVAVDLITSQKLGLEDSDNRCLGAYVLNEKTGKVVVHEAGFVVLATGGCSKAYLYTSNPDGASGDGIAMAWRAGCRVANMEFNQFHPTCLFHPQARTFLITEAIRGEGGHLKLPNGKRFMHLYDEREELAPRDIVARAIDAEMKKRGLDCVYLDISYKDADFIRSYFPTIYKKCLKLGIDITKEPIPVVPAAHYSCGGVMVDRNGKSDISGLYAIGETSFTGLHGANRMASNSLLECFVFAFSCAEHITSNLGSKRIEAIIPDWDETQVTDSDEEVIISHNWDEIRRFMWDYVGIVRTNKRLERASHRIDLLQKEIIEYYKNYRVNTNLLELRNLALVAELIIQSAQNRKESRGLHFTLDYPDLAGKAEDTILIPPNYQDRASS